MVSCLHHCAQIAIFLGPRTEKHLLIRCVCHQPILFAAISIQQVSTNLALPVLVSSSINTITFMLLCVKRWNFFYQFHFSMIRCSHWSRVWQFNGELRPISIIEKAKVYEYCPGIRIVRGNWTIICGGGVFAAIRNVKKRKRILIWNICYVV